MFKDSVGNTYKSLPTRKPTPGSKKTRNKVSKRATSKVKQAKHARYRQMIGKPNGPGQPGNKAGKNRIKKG